jgi:hypothetical protein
LAAMLEDGDPDVAGFVQANEPQLSTLFADRYPTLCHAIDDYAFDRALLLIQKVAP